MNYSANELISIYYNNRDCFFDSNMIKPDHKLDNVIKIDIENVSKMNLQPFLVNEGNISIVKNNSVNAAFDLKDQVNNVNEKICILNMGSYKTPGGGIDQGHNSQEENLYRCSDLSFIITRQYYPLLPNHVIYTQDVAFLFNGNYAAITKPKNFDIITAAAVKIGDETSVMSPYVKDPTKYMNSLIEGILIAPALMGAKHLILGAFGCGAYGNDPKMVSHSFSQHLKKYSRLYKSIVFALVNDANSIGDNVKVFSEVLKSYDLVK